MQTPAVHFSEPLYKFLLLLNCESLQMAVRILTGLSTLLPVAESLFRNAKALGRCGLIELAGLNRLECVFDPAFAFLLSFDTSLSLNTLWPSHRQQ